MLWGLTKLDGVSEAKKYHSDKYGIVPDTFEINPSFAEKIGIDVKSRSYDGMNMVISKTTTTGTIVIGMNKEVDEFKYLKKEK